MTRLSSRAGAGLMPSRALALALVVMGIAAAALGPKMAQAAEPAAAAASGGECVSGLVDALTLQINDVMARAGVVIPDVRSYVAAPLVAFNSCISTVTANSGGEPEPKVVEWMLYPGWQGGAIFDIMRIAGIVLSNLKRYNFLHPDMLPPPSALTTPDDFTQQLRKPKVNYTLISQDLSGMSMTDFLTNPDVHLDRLSSLPVFHDLPENFCVDPLTPRGPLHPRTFLLTVYRADVLSALAAEGLVPDPLVALSEWVDLLSLMDTYAGLVRRQQQDPTSLPPRLPTLPPFPVCINTDTLCGRQTDVLSAIAASVIQTRGNDQGYFLDLSPRPPAVAPLFNTTGWRYAAGMLAALLRHNPSPEAAAAAAAAMGVLDGEGGPSCHGISQVFTSGQCLLTVEFDSVLVLGTSVPPISQPGQIGVAPLPGSRLVAPPQPGYTPASSRSAPAGVASDSGDGGGSGSGSSSSSSRGAKYGLDERGLVPCTEELCATSHNHDLLYLQPTVESAEAAAAASDSAWSRNRIGTDTERTTMGDSLLQAFARREQEAAARVRSNPGKAVMPPLVNRAPYSVILDWAFNVRYKGLGVDTASLGDMVAMQQWSVSGLDGFRARRQGAVDGLRQRLGFATDVGASQEHACNGYATEDWWRLLAPSQRLITNTSSSSSTARPPAAGRRLLLSDGAAAGPGAPRNLSYLYADWAESGASLAASAGSGDAAGLGGHLYRALWHALHSPNLAADMRSPVVINFFRYGIDHGSMLLLPSNGSNSSSSNNNSSGGADVSAAVDEALALMDRVWRMATAALGGSVVRAAYEASIAAPDWQAPPGDSRKGDNVSTIAISTVVAVCAASVLLVLAIMAAQALRRRRHKRNRDVWGRVLAPRAGPDTTLLVTDVQNSTVLWEGLPVSVMDIVLKLHHGIIRSVLSEYDGYESATEGDSFIVAFTSPSAALDFATSCQVALIKADWPPALLDHPDGAPLLVLSPHDPRDAENATAALAALGLLPSCRMSSRRLMPSASGVAARVGFGGRASSRKSVVGTGSPASSRGGNRVSAAGGHGPFATASAARRLSAPGSVGGQLMSPALLPQPSQRASAGRDRGALPTGVRSAEVPFSFTTSSLGLVSSTTGLDCGVGVGGVGGSGKLSGPHDHLTGAGAPAEPAGARPVSANGIMARFALRAPAGVNSSGGAAAAAGPVWVSGDGGGGAGSGAGDALGCCSCAWRDMMAAAFPVLPLDTPEGRRLAMLIGASGREPRAGEEGGSASHSRGKEKGGDSDAELEEEGEQEEEEEEEEEDEGALAQPAGVRRAATGLEDVMRGSAAAMHVEGWEPGATAPCVHLPDGRLALVAFRGLRVRMGLHTGLDDPEAVSFNKVASAYAYKGPFAEMAKLVSDAAHGGLITLSGEAFSRLRNTKAATTTAKDKAAAKAHHEEAAAAYAGDEEEGGAVGSAGSGGSAMLASFLRRARRVLGLRREQTAAAAAAADAALRGAIVVFAGRHVLAEPVAPPLHAAPPPLQPPPLCASSAAGRGLSSTTAAAGSGTVRKSPVGVPDAGAFMPAGPVAEASSTSREPSAAALEAPPQPASAPQAAPAAGCYSLAGTAAAAGGGAAAAGASLLDGVRADDRHAGAGFGGFSRAAALAAPLSPTSAQPVPEVAGTAAEAGLAPLPLCLARLASNRQQPFLQHRSQSPPQPHRLHACAGISDDARGPGPSSYPQAQPQPSNLAAMLAEALAEAASATASAIGSPKQRHEDADDPEVQAPPSNGSGHAIPARLRIRQRAGGGSGGGRLPRLGPTKRRSQELLTSIMPECAQAVFIAAHPALVCRLALAAPLRVVKQCALGSLAAPVRYVTVAFMKVAGASTLLSDLPGPAARGLDAFQRLALGLLAVAGGYAVEAGDGLVLAAFGSAVAAVGWAADCVAALRRYPWEEALLAHELCAEELAPGGAVAAVASSPDTPTATLTGGWGLPGAGGGGGSFTLRRQLSVLMQTGPRVKCGLDVGEVTHTLTEASGRLSYRGRPMNRAARIAGICAAGQVLVSGDTWAAAAGEDERLLERYCGVSLGRMALKGLAHPIEVVEVVPEEA
ncbi:hypothetical protein HXX76_008475 [Chlamydomonas incerta]|uniref:Guanylate cyclase domain-containing protein n=1 Tax=Chlamydomonas incerta TaxID=51695 RepID=A0A835SU71_CHLIN|nr:hypothetical protein HXX76_008475 [Chlamydomonas incerta]|eukprot:KAG2433417.1 hypothetical protein HXX76_008475 [Chlamydomonas incerta]